MSRDKKSNPQPVELKWYATPCARYVPGKGKGGGCALSGGHAGSCVQIRGGGH